MLTIYYITALEGTETLYWDGWFWSTDRDDACEFRIEEEGVNEFDAITDRRRNMSLEKGGRFNG